MIEEVIIRDSELQIAVFNAVKNTNSNVAVISTAGSGKTTTILKSLHFIPKNKKTIFLSFSKAIVEELQSRIPMHVEAATLHKVGFGMFRRYFTGRKIEVKEEKYFLLAIGLIKESKGGATIAKLVKKDYRAARLISEVCGYARMTLTPFERQSLQEMCAYYNIEFDEMIIDNALKLLKDALKVGKKYVMVDFVDMIYFPVAIKDIVDVEYDVVFLDEAQDTNKAQLAMLELILKKDARLISVGDDYQCIYGFSGADVESFKRIRERPNTLTLPLSVSYRCPKKVVQKAKTVCEHIEAWEHAKEGEERAGTWDEIKDTDMILSRTTKPLIGLYFDLLEKGVRARVVGKDIEAGLTELAEDCMSDTKEGVLQKLELKFDVLETELRAMGIQKPQETPSWRALTEKFQVINLILRKIEDTLDLIPTIKEMFHDKRQAARLMTIHRSKGLENDRVFIIEKVDGQPLMPSKWARQEWEHIQERNLSFVAYTRPKSELIFINLNDQ